MFFTTASCQARVLTLVYSFYFKGFDQKRCRLFAYLSKSLEHLFCIDSSMSTTVAQLSLIYICVADGISLLVCSINVCRTLNWSRSDFPRSDLPRSYRKLSLTYPWMRLDGLPNTFFSSEFLLNTFFLRCFLPFHHSNPKFHVVLSINSLLYFSLMVFHCW